MTHRSRFLALLLAALLVASLTPALAEEEPVVITLVGTCDLHGCIASYDYAIDAPTKNTGLARAASYIAEQRAIDPELILVDNGDSIQGNMISLFNDDMVHPMINAFNLLGYDIWNLGNHEFNYDFSVISRAVANFHGDVLIGNAYYPDGSGMAGTKPYVIKEVKGVKVGIFGVIAPHITRWEASDPTHYDNMAFRSPEEQTALMVAELRDQVDILIGMIHYGREGEYETAGVDEIAEKFPEVDAFMAGHSHEVLPKEGIETAGLIVEPGNNGMYVSKLTFAMEQKDGEFVVADKAGETVAMADYEPDEALLTAMRYVHDYSVMDANTVIGQVAEDFLPEVFLLPGIPVAQIQDTALMDLINIVQMHYTGADVSLAALFTTSANLKAGDFRKKDSVNVYMYDNTLMAVPVTGAQLKAIMERCAGAYFNEYREGDVTISFDPNIRVYNYDMFAGVDYEIDISRPVGDRIVNLIYKGEPLAPETELVLALNNYRYGALLTAGLLTGDVVFDSAIDLALTPAVRDLISVYVQEMGGVLTPVCDNNWRIVGADLEDPAKELIYEMVRNGEIPIPVSEDGRTPNVKSLNANDLREQGIIPAELEPAA